MVSTGVPSSLCVSKAKGIKVTFWLSLVWCQTLARDMRNHMHHWVPWLLQSEWFAGGWRSEWLFLNVPKGQSVGANGREGPACVSSVCWSMQLHGNLNKAKGGNLHTGCVCFRVHESSLMESSWLWGLWKPSSRRNFWKVRVSTLQDFQST